MKQGKQKSSAAFNVDQYNFFTAGVSNVHQHLASTPLSSFEEPYHDTGVPFTVVTTSTQHQHRDRDAATRNASAAFQSWSALPCIHQTRPGGELRDACDHPSLEPHRNQPTQPDVVEQRKPPPTSKGGPKQLPQRKPPPTSKGGRKQLPQRKRKSRDKILKEPPKIDATVTHSKVIQPWHAVLGDQQSGACTTQGTVIFKQTKKDWKANNKNKSVEGWADQALQDYYRRVNDEFKDVPEFEAASEEDRKRILVKCTQNAITSGRVGETEYRYAGDKEDSYGKANLALAISFELRSPNSTDLGDTLNMYEDKLIELEKRQEKPPESDMDSFKAHLQNLKHNYKNALLGNELSKMYVKRCGKIKVLQEFWRTLTTVCVSVSTPQLTDQYEGANKISVGAGARESPMDFNYNPQDEELPPTQDALEHTCTPPIVAVSTPQLPGQYEGSNTASPDADPLEFLGFGCDFGIGIGEGEGISEGIDVDYLL
jgi:hypothetical protein